jgi:outer membrane protein assembly factor BamB
VRCRRWFVALAALTCVSAAAASVVPVTGDTKASSGVLLAYGLGDGRQLWASRTPGFFALEDVSDAMVVGRGFRCDTGPFRMIGYSAARGTRRWSTPANESMPSSRGGDSPSTGANRTGVAVSMTDKHVNGLAVDSGHVRWSVAVAGFPIVHVSASLVLVSSAARDFPSDGVGNVTAYDRSTGEKRWTITAPNAGLEPYTFTAGRTVAIGMSSQDRTTNQTIVVDAATGAERWTSPLALVGVSGATVLLKGPDAQDAKVQAHDATDGQLMWERDGSVGSVSPMGTRLGLSTGLGSFTVVNARDGKAQYELSGVSVAANARVVVYEQDQVLHVIDAATGKKRWSTPLPTGYDGLNALRIGKNAVYVDLGCFPNAG